MTNLITNITTYSSIGFFIIGILATIVSIITEDTKNIGFLKKIPTDLEVLILSIGLTVILFFAYVSYANIIIKWYLVVGAILGGFLVAFIAMYGWSKFSELWQRFKNPTDTK